eukprot:3105784-Rhodomonas_salina.1
MGLWGMGLWRMGVWEPADEGLKRMNQEHMMMVARAALFKFCEASARFQRRLLHAHVAPSHSLLSSTNTGPQDYGRSDNQTRDPTAHPARVQIEDGNHSKRLRSAASLPEWAAEWGFGD